MLDLIGAHHKSIEYLSDYKKSHILNIGTGKGYSVLEIIRKVEEITDTKIPIKRQNIRLGEYGVRVASNKKAQEVLGWQPHYSIEESIQSAFLWYKNHPKRWL